MVACSTLKTQSSGGGIKHDATRTQMKVGASIESDVLSR